MKYIRVSQDGTAEYRTIKEALEKASFYKGEKVAIEISEGVYREKLEIKQSDLTICGIGKVRIEYDDYGYFIMPDGEKRGTFRTQTVFLDADRVIMKNITIANTAGYGAAIGQAIALYADGTNLYFENCRFLGHQDTLFLAPLPEKEYEKNGFRGPKQFAPRIHGTQYYYHCYIEGTVDFIFGGATAYFEECHIHALNDKSVCYITAASTQEGYSYGFVFEKCRFTGNTKERNVYLGRPWRNHARTAVLHSDLGEQIAPEGWNDWGKQDAWNTILYEECGNTGKGAEGNRAVYSRCITEEEAKAYQKEKVLAGSLFSR